MVDLNTRFTALLLIFSVLQATAVPAMRPKNLEVYNPVITAPTADITWHVGSSQSITWKTSDIPRDKRNAPGMILLGHIADDSENLNIAFPLANKFLLRTGIVNVTVPKVAYRKDYVIVLFGDSGNTSPKFTIAPSPTR